MRISQLLMVVGMGCLAGGAFWHHDALTGVGVVLFVVSISIRRE